MAKVPANGLTTPHAAGIAPPPPPGKKDPCRHRRNKKKQVFVVYVAQELGSSPPKFYIGRTRGTGTVAQAVLNRERGHHRTDIGSLQAVCVQDSYSACRGAEQKHLADLQANGQAITAPRTKGKGKQIAPISKDNPKKKDYEDCAKESALNGNPVCPVCSK